MISLIPRRRARRHRRKRRIDVSMRIEDYQAISGTEPHRSAVEGKRGGRVGPGPAPLRLNSWPKPPPSMDEAQIESAPSRWYSLPGKLHVQRPHFVLERRVAWIPWVPRRRPE